MPVPIQHMYSPMIGYLSGTVRFVRQQSAIIETGGVGYLVYLGSTFLGNVSPGSEISIFIHTVVKDDAIDLYGFSDERAIRLFEHLLSVSGVGPKTALTVVDRGVSAVEAAVIAGDVAFFTGIPRLGKKNAQKIIIDLKSKLGSLGDLDLNRNDDRDQELVSALLSMGFRKSEVTETVTRIDPTLPLPERIRLSLRQMGTAPK